VISFGQQIENSSYFEKADTYRREAPIGVGEKNGQTIEKFMSETFGSAPLPTAVQTSSAATLTFSWWAMDKIVRINGDHSELSDEVSYLHHTHSFLRKSQNHKSDVTIQFDNADRCLFKSYEKALDGR
jgi:hypothetical protein